MQTMYSSSPTEGAMLGESYPSAEMQSMYSATQADRAMVLPISNPHININKNVENKKVWKIMALEIYIKNDDQSKENHLFFISKKKKKSKKQKFLIEICSVKQVSMR